MKRFIAIAVLVVGLASIAWAGYISAPHGYSVYDTVFQVPVGGWPASFDILPDGSFVVHTGQYVLKVEKSGASRVLFSYGRPTYGSFVKVDGERKHVLFGESSTGLICVMGLDGSSPRPVTTAPFNFDCEIDRSGRAFVVWSPTGYSISPQVVNISAIDMETGDLDLIVQGAGPTGSIAFDKKGNLIYGTVSSIWGQRGGQKLYRFSAEQVASAYGEGFLSLEEGEVIADDVDSPYDIAIDVTGRICFTSTVSSPSTIWRLEGNQVVSCGSMDPTSWTYASAMRWNANAGGFSVLVGGVFDNQWNPLGVISTQVRGVGRRVW